MLKHFISSLILLSITLNAQTVLYVSKSGSSTPPYSSWETAASTISLAYEAANDDDTIFVANGNYKENLYIGKRLTLIGESSDNTILDGRNLDDKTLRADSSLSIQNLRIIGKEISYNTAVYGILFRRWDLKLNNVRVDSSTNSVGGNGNLTATNCIFNMTKRAIGLSDVMLDNYAYINNCIVIACKNSESITSANYGNIVIFNSVFTPGTKGEFKAAYITGSDLKSFVFRNNIVNYASLLGVEVNTVSDSVIIENNVFLNQSVSSTILAGGVYMYRRNNPVIRNNIFYKCYYGANTLENGSEKAVYLNYNGYFGNTHNTLGVGPGMHAVFADPMFVQEGLDEGMSEFDYRLQMYSPMIDAGHPDIKDKDGTRSDIGAFGGPGGESYSYQDLPPLPPAEVTVDYDSGTGAAVLNWTENSAADFESYKLYRSNTQNLTATQEYLYSTIDTNSFTDTDIEADKNYYYIITGLDKQGNEGEASTKVEVILTNLGDTEVTPVYDYKLIQNYPNPFNPSTKIVYHLKESGYVRLAVYTLTGEIIDELVSEHQQSGYHELTFDGSNLASGMYLYKIEAKDSRGNPVFSSMKKMVLVK